MAMDAAFLLLATTLLSIEPEPTVGTNVRQAGVTIARELTMLRIKRPPDTSIEQELYDLALDLLAKGELKAAYVKALRLTNSKYRRDLLLLAVSKANGRDLQKALKTTEAIASDSRRAQAVLEVALVQHQIGNRKKAIEIAESVNFLHFRSGISQILGDQAFQYNLPETWIVQYDADDYFTMRTAYEDEQIAGDLAATALRLFRSLNGTLDTSDAFRIAFADCPPSMSQKLSEAQTRAGDPLGAWNWVIGLNNPRSVIEGGLGILRGVNHSNH
jgi:hypothetical protein